MSTHKHMGAVCVAATLLSLLVVAAVLVGRVLGVAPEAQAMAYESRLFDTSSVHTIDIRMDGWDAFIEGCEDEQYVVCDVVVDGELFDTVAIRAKGNTSLSTVSSLGSDRYSFKIEFDHYSNGQSYYGLDKLSLNNLIQDSTYMKDYLTYQAMAAFGVDAPLCSYVWVTVNGEDWGLYLAVEGVEDSFLERNYGTDHGELYKPDSLSMGGGVGNGAGFDMGDFDWGGSQGPAGEDVAATETGGAGESAAAAETDGAAGADADVSSAGDAAAGATPQGFAGQVPEGFDASGFDASAMAGLASGELPEGFDASGFDASLMAGFAQGQMPEGMELPEGFDASAMQGFSQGGFDVSFGGMGGVGGFGMGSSDVKLQYVDDDPASYPNIFDNAKTDVTAADQERLISSLEQLSAGENIEQVVDVDEVLRYFVVHTFVCNDDSYTGMMVHNYYLYEEDGRLSMIPWDYNLAYGTFGGTDATGEVNSPIDTPSSSMGSLPMLDWIFENEEYTELYHEYWAEFLETVDLVAMVEETAALIAPYVEADPSAFYTFEEHQQGVETLAAFCDLRSASVAGQLDGSIPATSSGQAADSSAFVDASALNLSDMGSMGGMGGGGGGMGGFGDMPASSFGNMPQGRR